MRKTLLLIGAATAVAMASFAADLVPDILLENGHLKRLRSFAEQRLKTNPNDAASLYYMGYIKFQQGDLDGALPLLEKSASLDPKNADCRYMIAGVYGRKAEQANIFRQLGLAKRYKQEAEATIALDPKHIDARMGLIEFHLRAPGLAGGDKKKADQYIAEIKGIDPAQGYLAEARKAIIEKQIDKLEALYKKAVEANPKDYQAHLALAGFYSRDDQKKYDQTEQLAREALKLDPDRMGAYNTLASLFAFQSRWQDLDNIIAQAEKAVPDNLAPYFHAGRVLSGSGKDNARAERYLQKYLATEPEPNGPSHALAHWRLGLVYEKMGRKADAIREIETAVRLNDDLEGAKKDLKRLK